MKTNRRRNLMQTPEGQERVREMERAKYQRRKAAGSPTVSGDHKPPVFIGVDGEGHTVGDRALYTVLAGYDAEGNGDSISDPEGLGTERVFAFLLKIGSGNVRLVIFGGNYDANHWLRDLDEDSLKTLWTEHVVYWDGDTCRWRIEWYERHRFTVSRMEWNEAAGRSVSRESVTVWDTFGFFQSSFLNALREWNVGDEGQRILIEWGKHYRAEFDPNSPTALDYNRTECILLAQLVAQLRDTLKAADIPVKRWDGAGAVASALLGKHHIENFNREFPEKIKDRLLRAYYGGRTQAFAVGVFPDEVHHYDINSAYPSEIAQLPTADGEWLWTDEYLEDEPWAVYRVTWDVVDCPGTGAVTPFPWRQDDGNIIYPLRGVGWYHAPLVRTAIQHYGCQHIQVNGGWVFRPRTDEKPFAWVNDLFATRREYQAAGDPRARVLKLGLNALYGKFSQGVGFKGSTPRFQNWLWAGHVTAAIQARLLDAALRNPEGVISITVDGLWSREPLDLDCGPDLGSWKHTTAYGFALFQPAVYLHTCRDCDGFKSHMVDGGAAAVTCRTCSGTGRECHTAGYRGGEFPAEDMLAGWADMQYAHVQTVTVRRFKGVGLALVDGLDGWRSWHTVPKRLRACPGAGFPSDDVEGRTWFGWVPPDTSGEEVSRPYVPKRRCVELDWTGAQLLAMAYDQPDVGG